MVKTKIKKPKRQPASPANRVALMLKKIGREEKIKVRLEPAWGRAGKIKRPDGAVTYFWGTNFDLNGLGAAAIAKDKAYCAYFLKQAGFRVIRTKVFHSPGFARLLKSSDTPGAAGRYVKKNLGFPAIIKPNSQSQGRLVCLVYNQPELLRAAREISKIDRNFLAQPFINGHDYRLVVLDDEVLLAYERLPLSVTGDGSSAISRLLNKKQKTYLAQGRDTVIDQNDFRINLKLKKQKLNRSTILPLNQKVFLLDNANLSTGGEAIDITSGLHSTYKNLAVKITRALGLRYGGVDLMVQTDPRLPLNPRTNNYHIIEVNAAPGIDHYAQSGPKQKKLIKRIYRKIFKKLVDRK